MAWVTNEFKVTTSGNNAYVVGDAVTFAGAGGSNIQIIGATLGDTKCDNFKVEYSLDGTNFDVLATSPDIPVLALGAEATKVYVIPQAYPYYRVNGHASDATVVVFDFVFAELVV
tara:strand:+ start:943 stop:1287 length:345 start_codon:yes stop_codon:yes gene_type:complete